MGRGGVKTKVNQGACYSLWNLCVKLLAVLKKDPSQVRKHPEQCFLRPDLNFFLESLNFVWFAISVTLKMTILKYFFVKKKIIKKNANKIRRKNLSKKKLIRVHATHYEIYVSKYLLFWKKTQAKSGNIRNDVF